MKRGLISWDKSELPSEEFDSRLQAAQRLLAEHELDALVIYSDVWRSNDLRYVSNYMPYWNRALAVVGKGEKPTLLCALSPRVYPWIKTVTIHEDIRPSPNLIAQLETLCAEKGWNRIGVLDRAGLPYEMSRQLAALTRPIVDVPRGALRPAPTEVEARMHAIGARLARQILEDELGKSMSGLTDRQLTARLERALRRAGAEDLVILVSDGSGPPAPATGARVGANTSVVLALEYKGHWCKLARNLAGLTAPPPQGEAGAHREWLSGPYAWQSLSGDEKSHDAVICVQSELAHGAARLFYGDTYWQRQGSVRLL